MEARDPVCGMTVDTDNPAAKEHYNGQNYYFCSTQCRDRFDAEPGRYAGSPTHTDKGFTAPHFGDAGSGGAEFEGPR